MNPVDLLALIDRDDPARAEARLAQIRRSLTRFFEWRGMRDAEDLAHTTLTRGLEKIAEGATVYNKDPGGFFYGIARNVLQEATRDRRRVGASLDGVEQAQHPLGTGLNPMETKIYLDQCLREISGEERRLLTDYVTGTGTTKGITTPAERLRVHRIRKKLAKLREK